MLVQDNAQNINMVQVLTQITLKEGYILCVNLFFTSMCYQISLWLLSKEKGIYSLQQCNQVYP